MPVFVKIERGVVAKDAFDAFVPAHRAYVRSLIERGHKARTGYWADFGGGMMLFEADSLAEAERIVAEDPLVKNRCVETELHQWITVEG